MITEMQYSKLCLVGSQEPYPAFDSVLSIARDILGRENVTELRIRNPSPVFPRILKPLIYILQDLALFIRILKLRKKEKITSLLLFQAYWPLTCIGLRLFDMKLVLYIGGSGFEWSQIEGNSWVNRIFAYSNLPMQRICHRFADMLITLSPRMAKMIDAKKYENKTWFALPRIDREFFNQFRLTKDHECRNNVVGYVGTLVRRKGILNLIKAIPIIIKKKDCQFLIIGDGPLMKTVKNAVQNLQIDKSVNILGFVDYNSLGDYYNRMKIYVLPSYAEGIPSTIFEAMACGTPVLVTGVGGISDIIQDGNTGFLLSSNNPNHITNKIIQLLEDPELLKRASTNAYKYVRENFNEEKIIEPWRRIFQNIDARAKPYLKNAKG